VGGEELHHFDIRVPDNEVVYLREGTVLEQVVQDSPGTSELTFLIGVDAQHFVEDASEEDCV
jgi:hypothetical protein